MRLALRLGGPVVALAVGLALAPSPAHATFHEMQIEKVIGGVNNDLTAQAIQLRMRASGQNLVSNARMYAWDATGSNPVLIIDFKTNVSNPTGRVLVTSPNFSQYLSITPNFVMTHLIPPSYLTAGKLTYEDDFGTVLWSLAWGGSNYTGTNTGDVTNDLDGDFGPPFPGPLPYSSIQAVTFTGAATALSTTNAADYTLSGPPVTLTNNAPASANVTALPSCSVIAGSDLFTTPASGMTYDDFQYNPIPLDFFGPGSDPFSGSIVLGGRPLGPLGPTDTVIRRDSSAPLSGPGSSFTIPIEIVALSLVSAQPITVTYNGGQTPESWDVSACLSSTAQPVGSMTVKVGCACSEGGTFTSTLPVIPKLVFTRTNPTPATVTLDFGPSGRGPMTYSVPFGHWLPTSPSAPLFQSQPGVLVDGDCNPGTAPADLLPTTNFVSGGRADRCTAGSCTGAATLAMRVTPEVASNGHQGLVPALASPANDGDADGVADVFDNCPAGANPQQQDIDDDGLGDLCDNCLHIYNPCQEDADQNGIGDVCDPAGVVGGVPSRIELGAPVPNPARTTIGFNVSLPRAATVRLGLYDLHGRQIGSTLTSSLGAGVHRLDWRLVRSGTPLRSGTYYLRLNAAGEQHARSFQVVQ